MGAQLITQLSVTVGDLEDRNLRGMDNTNQFQMNNDGELLLDNINQLSDE